MITSPRLDHQQIVNRCLKLIHQKGKNCSHFHKFLRLFCIIVRLQNQCSYVCHLPRSELNNEDAGHHHGVEFAPHSASSEKRRFQNIHHKPLDSGGSPFPTPLVLRDDMQTPGTAYASHRGTSISGKRVRTRKLFIYPVLRSIENRLQQTEEAPSPNELLDGKGLPKSDSDEKNGALSLSRWLKSSSTDAENQGDAKCSTGDQSYDGCSFQTERPVFMASDLNLDTYHPTPRLPKAWVGNGIPNTTTRYKEVLICHSM